MRKLLLLLIFLPFLYACEQKEKSPCLAKDMDDETLKACIQEAEQGGGWFQVVLAGKYRYGFDGVEQDYEKALYWYKLAAKHSAFAQKELGHMYEYGHGVEQNYAKAIEWYKLAAQRGNPNSIEDRDYKDSVILFEEDFKLAKQGDAEAQSNIGYYYKEKFARLFRFRKIGLGASSNPYLDIELNIEHRQNAANAIYWNTLSAEQGNANAQISLGEIYWSGYGVQQDYNKALQFYKSAAEQGNANAQRSLGEKYRYGYGDVQQDCNKALQLYKSAAKNGDVDTKRSTDFGEISFKESYTNFKSDFEALKYIRQEKDIKKQIDADIQNKIGDMYEQGSCVEQDYTQAIKWYKLAANQGNAEAQESLDSVTQYVQRLEQEKQDEQKREARERKREASRKAREQFWNQFAFLYLSLA